MTWETTSQNTKKRKSNKISISTAKTGEAHEGNLGVRRNPLISVWDNGHLHSYTQVRELFRDVKLDLGCVAMEVTSSISLEPVYPPQHSWQWWQVPFLCSETALETTLPPSQCTALWGHTVTKLHEGKIFSFPFLKLDSSVCASTTEIETLAERSPHSGDRVAMPFKHICWTHSTWAATWHKTDRAPLRILMNL